MTRFQCHKTCSKNMMLFIVWVCRKSKMAAINPQSGNGVFSTFTGNGGAVIYSSAVKVIVYAIGDRYRPAVKIYSAEMIGGLNQYSIFTAKFQNGRQNGRPTGK